MVAGETMAERTPHGTRGAIRRTRLLRCPALRGVLHLRADWLCAGESIYDLRVLRPALDASDGGPRRADSQPLCEIHGGGRGSLAFFTKLNRVGSAVQRNSWECFGDRVHSRQEGDVHAGL